MTVKTEKEFLKELKALFEKYSIILVGYDKYDGDGGIYGTDFTLLSDGVCIDLKDLESEMTNIDNYDV